VRRARSSRVAASALQAVGRMCGLGAAGTVCLPPKAAVPDEEGSVLAVLERRDLQKVEMRSAPLHPPTGRVLDSSIRGYSQTW
jgi:hypothetical protein